MNKGRLLGLGFGLFALVCAIVSFDYARGRTPQTQSAVVLDILATGEKDRCRRDVSAIVQRHIPLGESIEKVLATVDALRIEPPAPWFWAPVMTSSFEQTPARLTIARTLRATAFGSEVLMLEVVLAEAKVASVSAKVACRFK